MATTTTARIRLTALLGLAAIMFPPVSPRSDDAAGEPAAATPDPAIEIIRLRDGTEITIEPLYASQVAAAEWALSRFEAAGLPLPSLTIVFHESVESCGMRQGVLRISSRWIELHECEQDEAAMRRSLLHELAHAWDHVSGGIDPATRQRFLELRDLTSWDDESLAWNQRGEEQAAEIIAWGLTDEYSPIRTSVNRRGQQDVPGLARAFELLVGSPPPFLVSAVAETGDTECSADDLDTYATTLELTLQGLIPEAAACG